MPVISGKLQEALKELVATVLDDYDEEYDLGAIGDVVVENEKLFRNFIKERGEVE